MRGRPTLVLSLFSLHAFRLALGILLFFTWPGALCTYDLALVIMNGRCSPLSSVQNTSFFETYFVEPVFIGLSPMAIFIFAFLAMLVVPTLAAPVVYPVTSTERAQEDAEKYSPSSSEYRDSPNAVPGLMRDYSEYAHRAARGEASAHQPLSPGAGGRYPRHFDGVAAPLLEKMGEGRIVRLVRRKVTIPKVSSGGSKVRFRNYFILVSI